MSINSIQNGRDHLVALPGKSTNLLVYRHLLTVFLLVLSLFWMIRARESAIDFLQLDSPHVSPGVRYRHFWVSHFQDHWMGDDQLWLEAVPGGSTIGFQVPTRALGTRRLEITYTVARDHGRYAILLDGMELGVIDARAKRVARRTFLSEPVVVEASDHVLVFRSLEASAAAHNNRLGLDSLAWRHVAGPSGYLYWLSIVFFLLAVLDLLLSRFRKITFSLLLIAGGTAVLLTIVPHRDPWRAWALDYPFAQGQIALQILDMASYIILPPLWFVVASIWLLFHLLLLHPISRRALARLVQTPKYTVGGQLAMLGLIGSLYPTTEGWALVSYLVLGSVAVLMLIMGLANLPHLIRLGPIKTAIHVAWLHVARRFTSINRLTFLATVFTLELVLAGVCSYILFQHTPHVEDSAVQVFQARIFAQGHLSAPIPEHAEFFHMPFMIRIGNQWHCQYPPGHSFMLMLGALVGAPWIMNPLCGAVTVCAFYFAGKWMYDELTGRISALLGLLSPFILFMSSGFMNHATALLAFSLFMAFFAKAVRFGKVAPALLAGLALGLLVNTRPWTALGLVVPFSGYALYLLVRDARRHALTMAALVAVTLGLVAVLLVYNDQTNGSPWLFGYEAFHGPNHNPGFGRGFGGPPLTPELALEKTLRNTNALNKYLFEWPIPSLTFVAILFALISRRIWDYVLLCSFLGLVIAYYFYWFQDWCFGPRFLYEASGLLILLSARGILVLIGAFRRIIPLRKAQLLIMAGVGTCCICSWCGHIPKLLEVYGNDYWGSSGKMVETARNQGLKNAIVFVRGRRRYFSSFSENSPQFDGPVIYARDLRHKHVLMKQFPGRKCFLERNGSLVPIENHR